MSKETCPKCGSKDFVVCIIPKFMPHPGRYTNCPVCDAHLNVAAPRKEKAPKKTK